MALPTFNTKSPTIKRILKEAAELSKNADPTLHAAPLETDLFEWHFTIRGPPSTPYADGAYHGRIILPQQYPLRPPSFRFLTPSGRFESNREICLSISGHHEETWQPAWGIRTALWALRAFMEGGAKGQVGGMEMGEAERRRLAQESNAWKCVGCGGRTNNEILKSQQEEGVTSSGAGVIPDELKFGYKDEMPASSKAKSPESVRSEAQETEDAREVLTDTQESLSTDNSGKDSSAESSTSTSTQARTSPLQAVPSLSTQRPPQPLQTVGVREAASQDAVPGWVDKAIVGVLAMLIVVVVRKFTS
ncbi:MAG: hypothetical protein Q9195_008311 [Heterodermia aff. obscurata]